MILKHGLHLAYCTNIHRGETWAETFAALKTHTVAVREKVCPSAPFAIGLRLSHRAALTLSQPRRLREFQRWLARQDCYVFTINGFPYGRFHGSRVKEQVYAPDWTTTARLAYTNRLVDLLAKLLPPGIAGSVSTVPGSFKEFITSEAQARVIRQNLWRCVEHLDRASRRTGRELTLGLEPEPLGWLENTSETIAFFQAMQAERPHDFRLRKFMGVNYDSCHFAIEYEEPRKALASLQEAGIKISKIHLSSALMVKPSRAACAKLESFSEDVYLHQVIARDRRGNLTRYRDLPDALKAFHNPRLAARASEWRVHFHIPLHAPSRRPFQNTHGHLLGLLDLLGENPSLCSNLEMETYTWEVLPPQWKAPSVDQQLAAEYAWTLRELAKRGLATQKRVSHPNTIPTKRGA